MSGEQSGACSKLTRVHSVKVGPEADHMSGNTFENARTCSSPAFLWKQVTRPPGEQCTCLFGGAAAVRVRDLVGVVTSPRNVGSTQRPDTSTISTQRGSESMKRYSSSPVTQSGPHEPAEQARHSSQGLGQWGWTMAWVRAFGEPKPLHAIHPWGLSWVWGTTGRGLGGSVC